MFRLSRTRRKKDEERVRSGVGRRERMKQGGGFKGRDETSRGIEILMTDTFADVLDICRMFQDTNTRCFKFSNHLVQDVLKT
jgi:hypothetical protein